MADRVSYPFNIEIDGDVSVEITDTDLNFSIHFEKPIAGLREYKFSIPRAWLHRYAETDFDSDDISFIETLTRDCLVKLQLRLTKQIGLFYEDMAQMFAAASDSYPYNQLIDDRAKVHSQFVRDDLKRMTPTPESRGHRSQWTGSTLRYAIERAVESMPKHLPRTYKSVIKQMRKLDKDSVPEKIPASDEALRKLVSRFGLNWKTLIAPQKATRRAKPTISLTLHARTVNRQ